MSTHATKVFALTAGLTMAIAMSPAAAQETGQDSDDGFSFQLDPVLVDYRLLDDDQAESAKFQEYRDFYDGFGIPEFHLTGRADNGERALSLTAENVGRDDAHFFLNYNVWGRYRVQVDFNKIPHRFGNDGTILWSPTAPGVLEISDSVQQDLQGQLEAQAAVDPGGINFDFLNGLIRPHLAAANIVDLGLQRDRTRIRADIGRMKTFSVGVEVFHENRKGNRPFGNGFGFSNVTEIYEFIDYDTVDVELSGEWHGKKAGVTGGFRHSSFTNHIDSLTWDNPWRAVDSTDSRAYISPGSGSINGSTRGRVTLPADNQANTAFLRGHARLGTKGWVNGNLSYAVLTQDDDLLPFTINTSINLDGGAPFDASDPGNLPVRTADRNSHVITAGAAAGIRPMDKVDLRVRYQVYDYNDKSDRIETPGYVRFDAVWEEVGRITVPYSHTRHNLDLEAAYTFAAKTSLTLNYALEAWEREFREIDSSTEHVFRVKLKSRALDKVTLRARYEHGDRSIGDYSTEAQFDSFLEEEEINNQPGLRKYDEAARTYDEFRCQGQIHAGSGFDVTLGFSGRYEDYGESEFGLLSDDLLRFNAELNYSPRENTNLYAFFDHSDRESFQRARQSGGTLSTNPEDSWEVTFNETNDTIGAGFNALLADHWTFDVSGMYARSDGDGDFFTPEGGNPSEAVDFDNYEDIELFQLSAKLDYQISKGAEIGLGYFYEDYNIDSFILAGLDNYLPAALLLNANNGDYTAHIYASRLKFRF